MTHKEAKQAIRQYLQTGYNDWQLMHLVVACRQGDLQYDNICHCIRGYAAPCNCDEHDPCDWDNHYHKSKDNKVAVKAEMAMLWFGTRIVNELTADARRRRIILPMALAEQRRRRLALLTTQPKETTHDTLQSVDSK